MGVLKTIPWGHVGNAWEDLEPYLGVITVWPHLLLRAWAVIMGWQTVCAHRVTGRKMGLAGRAPHFNDDLPESSVLWFMKPRYIFSFPVSGILKKYLFRNP